MVVPSGADGSAGVTAIETRVGDVTVKVADPEMLPDVAVIVVGPVATDVASPDEELIVAFAVTDDVHVTAVVIVCVLPLV